MRSRNRPCTTAAASGRRHPETGRRHERPRHGSARLQRLDSSHDPQRLWRKSSVSALVGESRPRGGSVPAGVPQRDPLDGWIACRRTLSEFFGGLLHGSAGRNAWTHNRARALDRRGTADRMVLLRARNARGCVSLRCIHAAREMGAESRPCVSLVGGSNQQKRTPATCMGESCPN